MSRIVPMKCTSCGGRLEISSDMVNFACGYCGSSLKVERKGGTIALHTVTEAIKKVQFGTDRTAAELAMNRLKNEIDNVNKEIRFLEIAADSYGNPEVIIIIFIFIGLISLFGLREGSYGPLAMFAISFLALALIIFVVILFAIFRKRHRQRYESEIDKFEQARDILKQKFRKNKTIADSD
jgi:uncharacterized membrane protein